MKRSQTVRSTIGVYNYTGDCTLYLLLADIVHSSISKGAFVRRCSYRYLGTRTCISRFIFMQILQLTRGEGVDKGGGTEGIRAIPKKSHSVAQYLY